MTRFIKLPSVGTAINIDSLLTYPICSNGQILTNDSKPLQALNSDWWSYLSKPDAINLNVITERHKALHLLTKTSSFLNLVEEKVLNGKIKELLNQVEVFKNENLDALKGQEVYHG